MTIILPERGISRTKLLLPQQPGMWRAPSQRSGLRTTESQTRFRLTARLSDGYIVWRGWFDDRDDADAFLFAMVAGSLNYERELWRLPTPAWHPDLGEGLQYDFATVTFITNTSTTSFTRPSDWNTASNSVEVLGGGGAGGGSAAASSVEGGGGGTGGYSAKSNLTIAASVTIQVGSAGTGAAGANGGAGTATWFDGATLAASQVGANPGNGGTTVSVGGTGGSTVGATGTTKTAGSNGGSDAGFSGGDSGGGAPSSAGAGSNGVGSSSGNGATGGNASGVGGGTGGTGGAAGKNNGNPGNAGTNWDASHGSGGGGGGGGVDVGSGPGNGGAGGLYGAGGGGGGASGTGTAPSGGNASQGIIVVTYTPLIFVPHQMLNLVRPQRRMVSY